MSLHKILLKPSKRISYLFAAAVLLMQFSIFALSYTDFYPDSVVSDTNFMPYRYFIPTGYTAANKYPLVLFLHGSGGMGTDDIKQITDQPGGPFLFADSSTQQKYPCFVVCPQMNVAGLGFGTLQNQAFLLAILDTLEQKYNIDPNRIYITGLSMGGAGTVVTMQNAPTIFAAAAPLCPWFEGGDPNTITNVMDKPWWFFHGSADGSANPQNSITLVDSLRAAGYHPNFTLVKGWGHDVWTPAYADPDLVPWMFTKSLGWTWPLKADSVYHIVNVSSGKCLAGSASATDSSVAVTAVNVSDQSRQWTLQDAGSGYYRLINKKSGKALEIPSNASSPLAVNTAVVQGAVSTNDIQLWLVWEIGNRYKLVPKLAFTRDMNYYAIAPQNFASADNTPAVVTSYADTNAMRWTLDLVSGATSVASGIAHKDIVYAQTKRIIISTYNPSYLTIAQARVFDIQGRSVINMAQKSSPIALHNGIFIIDTHK